MIGALVASSHLRFDRVGAVFRMTDSQNALSRNEIFDLLSNSRRRYMLTYLANSPDAVTLQDLARKIAARENNCPVEDVTQKQQKRVYVSLYQTHVARLSEAGVISYDDSSGHLTLQRRASEVTPYLEENGSGERPWPWYYLAVVGISTIVFVATVFDVGPFATISETLVVIGIILAFTSLTVVNIYSQRSFIREPPGPRKH